jgi:drug/metabolite transporter (DMT)-like permease
LGAAVAVISVRKLSQTESTATLLVYQALFVGVLAGIPLFWVWVTPDLNGTLFLLAMGVVATVGQCVGVKSLRLGEESVIGNVQYSQLVYAAILGYALFSEVPDIYTIVGAAINVGSSVYMLHRESLQKRRQAR